MAVATQQVSTTAVDTGFDPKNLCIDDLIIHRVYVRDANKVVKDPSLSDQLMALPADGMDAIQQRLTSALGHRSHGIEMSIEKVESGNFFQSSAHAICADQASFIAASKWLAQKLTQAQAGTNGSAGMLIVLRGRAGAQPRRFLAVIKAEVHDGFGAGDPDQAVAIQYLSSLMLTPTQKLFKVGLLLELQSGPPQASGEYKASGYRAFLFDHLITATETRSAAAYFYSAFLGMDIQKSSKKLTRDFFEHTTSFIQTASLTDDAKLSLREALRVNLRSSSTILSVGDFAEAHIEDVSVRKSYCDHLATKGFPKNAVAKDVAYVKARLRRPRNLAFNTGVKISIPADADPAVFEVIDRTPTEATFKFKGSFTETA